MGAFISVRVPKEVMKELHKLKAQLILEKEAKVSDAEVIREAVEYRLAHEAFHYSKGRKRDLSEFAGFIKGGPKTNATEDVDEVLYGKRP